MPDRTVVYLDATPAERNIVNLAFREYGGDGYNDENLIQALAYSQGRSIVNAVRGGVAPPVIHFGLIANMTVNAVAKLDPTHGFAIGLNVGLVEKVFQAAYKLYPTVEKDDPIGTYWLAIAQIATSFVVEHECAHVLNGHLGFFTKETTRHQMLASSDDECLQQLAPLDLQTLEMDADACAVTRVVLWAVEIFRRAQSGYQVSKAIEPFFECKTEQDLLVNVIEAFVITIASLQDKDPRLQDCDKHSHIPRTARIFHAVELVGTVTERHLGYRLWDRIDQSQMFVVSSRAVSELSSTPLDLDVLKYYFEPNGFIHKLTSHFALHISQKLEARSFAPVNR